MCIKYYYQIHFIDKKAEITEKLRTKVLKLINTKIGINSSLSPEHMSFGQSHILAKLIET